MSLDMGANLFFAPLNIRLYAVLRQAQDGIAERKQVGVFSGVLSNCFGRRMPVVTIGFNDKIACRDEEVADVTPNTVLGRKVYAHISQKLSDDSLNGSASGVTVAPLQVAGMTAVLGVTDSKVDLLGEKLFSAVTASDTFSSTNGIRLALSRAVDSCTLLGQFLFDCKFFAALLAVLRDTASPHRVLAKTLATAKAVLSSLAVIADDFRSAVIALDARSRYSDDFSTGSLNDSVPCLSVDVAASPRTEAALSLEQHRQGNTERLPAVLAFDGFYVGLALLAIALRATEMRACFVRGEFFTAIIAMLGSFRHEKTPCRLSVDTLAEGVQLATRGLENKYSIQRTYRQRYSTLSTFSIAHFGDFNQVTT